MEAQKVISRAVDLLTEKSIKLIVDRTPKNRLHKFLMKIKVLPNQRTYKIRPTKLGSMLRISSRILKLPELSSNNVDALIQDAYNIAANNMDDLCYIVAVAIQNNKREPSKKLMEDIKNEFTSIELLNASYLVTNSLNLTDFTNSISLIAGLNILRIA